MLSCRSIGPRGPNVKLAVNEGTGTPNAVVNIFGFCVSRKFGCSSGKDLTEMFSTDGVVQKFVTIPQVDDTHAHSLYPSHSLSFKVSPIVFISSDVGTS